MEAIATASITSAFGNGFLSEFIRDTYSFLKDSSKYPQVQETMLVLDLKNFIPLAHNLVTFLEQKDLPMHIKLAVQQLRSSIQLIKDQLAFIQNTLTVHKNKLLHSIRPPRLGKHLQKLTVLKTNADKQFNYLLHLLPHDVLKMQKMQEIVESQKNRESEVSKVNKGEEGWSSSIYSEIQEISVPNPNPNPNTNPNPNSNPNDNPNANPQCLGPL
ncbi:MAG: hypothetical protein WD512_18910 [Candidatus Paceibacterota bacterium]